VVVRSVEALLDQASSRWMLTCALTPSYSTCMYCRSEEEQNAEEVAVVVVVVV